MVPLVPLRITAITHLASGHFLVQGTGAPNTPYHIEFSPDLSPGSFGSPAPVNSSPTGALQYDDANAGNLLRRFYRFTYP